MKQKCIDLVREINNSTVIKEEFYAAVWTTNLLKNQQKCESSKKYYHIDLIDIYASL